MEWTTSPSEDSTQKYSASHRSPTPNAKCFDKEKHKHNAIHSSSTKLSFKMWVTRSHARPWPNGSLNRCCGVLSDRSHHCTGAPTINAGKNSFFTNWMTCTLQNHLLSIASCLACIGVEIIRAPRLKMEVSRQGGATNTTTTTTTTTAKCLSAGSAC